MAAHNGHAAALAVLVVARADLDVANARGERPVAVAAAFGHAEALATLIDAGAAPRGIPDQFRAFRNESFKEKPLSPVVGELRGSRGPAGPKKPRGNAFDSAAERELGRILGVPQNRWSDSTQAPR